MRGILLISTSSACWGGGGLPKGFGYDRPPPLIPDEQSHLWLDRSPPKDCLLELMYIISLYNVKMLFTDGGAISDVDCAF